MLRNIELNRDNVLFLALVAGLSTLAVQLYLFELKVFTPLSPLFRRHPPYSYTFNEYVPLAIILLMLMWIKMGRLRRKKEDITHPMNLKTIALILVGSVLVVLILFRVWDVVAMLAHPHDINDIFIESRAEIWMHVFFFCVLSLFLFGFFTISYGLKGLKTMFIPAIFPAFYTFNTDIVVYADVIPSLSVFYPIYQFILELGRWETVAVGSLLNTFGVKASVYTSTFPYRVMMGGTVYLVDLPCIGWEGITAYTIIFLIFISELEIRNRTKVFWATLGSVSYTHLTLPTKRIV